MNLIEEIKSKIVEMMRQNEEFYDKHQRDNQEFQEKLLTQRE